MGKSETATSDKLWTAPFNMLIMINFFTYLGNFMLMSTLPLHVLNISGDKIMAGLITGIYSLTGFISRLQIGNLLDKKERVTILFAGLSVLLSVIICYNPAASSVIMLFVLRAIHGIGWGTTTTSTNTIASDLVPNRRRAEGMGAFGISISVAMVIGPGLGLYLMEHYTSTLLFIFSALVIMLALLTCLVRNFYYPDQSNRKAPATVNIINNTSIIAAVEKTALWPSFIFFIVVMTYSTIMIFLPPYAREKGIADIGLFFITMALSMIITRLTTGQIADKYGTTKIVVPGMILLAVGLLLLFAAPSLSMFLLAAVMYGLGFGAVQPALNAFVIILAPVERRGAANATFLGAMDMGGILGSIIWGAVAQAYGFIYIYSASAILILFAVAMYLKFCKVK